MLRQQLLGQRSPSRDVRASPSTKKGVAMAIVGSTRVVVGGVDTHLDEHVAAVVDSVGGVLGVDMERLVESSRSIEGLDRPVSRLGRSLPHTSSRDLQNAAG